MRARSRERALESERAWARELLEARRWLADQVTSWLAAAARSDAAIAASERRITELRERIRALESEIAQLRPGGDEMPPGRTGDE